jgi:anti-sigma B factor antagonist
VADVDPTSDIQIASARLADGTAVLTVTGDLDLMTAEPVREAVTTALRAGDRNLIFELGGLRFIDSAGLAILIEASSSADSIELRSPSPAVRRAIELTGLGEVLTVVP